MAEAPPWSSTATPLDALLADALLFYSGAAASPLDSDDDLELAPLVELVSADDAIVFEPHTTSSSDPTQPLDQPYHHPHVNQQPEPQYGPVAPLTARRSGKKEPRMHSNKARDERRSELIYLRTKASELETQLRTLQTRPPPYSGVLTSTTAAAIGADASSGLWQEIASRQSEERARSERENVRLKLVLENQLKIAKSLEKILYKRAVTKEIAQFTERVFTPATAASATADSDGVFGVILRDVERMYCEVDAVFEANGLAHTELPLASALVHSSAERGTTVLEVFANKLLPFDMHATADAVWHHFAFGRDRTPFRDYQFESSEFVHSMPDTIMESFDLQLDAKGTRAKLRVKQLLRRHVEADRIVILWRAPVEVVEFSDEPLPAVPFRESGYIVIKRPRSARVASHTLLQTCYITTTDFAGELVANRHLPVGAITDFVLAATATNISATNQIIENMLVEQSMRQRVAIS